MTQAEQNMGKEMFIMIGTIITAGVLVCVVGLVIAVMVKDKKKGKSVICGGDCKNCGGHCH